MFHLNIEGYCKTRPHLSYCFFVNVQASL